MTLVEKIMAVYPQLTSLDFMRKIVVLLDEDGEHIVKWEHELPQPTQDELDKATPPAPDMEAIVVDLVQKRLDKFAQSRGYDGILSACTYATSNKPKFKIEGLYCVDTRDAHWDTCYKILNEVLSGQRPLPTIEEVVNELPLLEWPN